MIDERKEETACLHALGLLDAEERSAFVGELEGNPELRRRAWELREAALSLSLTAPESVPPEELKARILASAGRQGVTSAKAPAGTGKSGIFGFPAWVPWLAAASIAVAAIWSQRQYSRARDEIAALSAQQLLADLALDQTREQLAQVQRRLVDSSRRVAELSAKLRDEGDLAHFKIATLASMLGNSPEALAVAVWDPSRQQGVLKVSRLPALASERTTSSGLSTSNIPIRLMRAYSSWIRFRARRISSLRPTNTWTRSPNSP